MNRDISVQALASELDLGFDEWARYLNRQTREVR